MTTPSYPALQRHHPLRPADWRWRRACWLVARGRYVSPRRGDEPTGRAVRYLRAVARSRTGRVGGLLKRYEDVHAARRLHEGGGAARAVVQAGLLARQTAAGIALRTGVPAAVIDAYECFFFNVRDCID